MNGYPVRYSGQILVFEFSYLPISRGCKSVQLQYDQERLKPKPPYKGYKLLLLLQEKCV